MARPEKIKSEINFSHYGVTYIYKFRREIMEYVGIVFGIFGFIAFVRVENLTKTLKAKGMLEEDYKD